VSELDDGVRRYYAAKFAAHGPTASGVDWNSEASQVLRFRQLLRIADGLESFSLVDFGCGYGALADYLDRVGVDCSYAGYDLSLPMIEHARMSHRTRTFTAQREQISPADVSVASGIFNVKQDVPNDIWSEHALQTIDDLASLGVRGFAFNMLTSYADAERKRSDLYYADPREIFDHCQQHHSRNVAILHDYGLYEFTVLVRR
jgi:SAM-dependent methyltransferase